MTSCTEFRSRFQAGTNDPALLEHLRRCDPCLDFAARIDPDVMFRAIGGSEMIPPGGVDAFVADVMHAVELRSKEGKLAAKPALTWPRRLAVAATIAAGITGATFLYETNRSIAPRSETSIAAIRPARTISAVTTTKPVVDTYSSTNATIVEVPTQSASDTKIVMVIDDTLPADL